MVKEEAEGAQVIILGAPAERVETRKSEAEEERERHLVVMELPAVTVPLKGEAEEVQDPIRLLAFLRVKEGMPSSEAEAVVLAFLIL